VLSASRATLVPPHLGSVKERLTSQHADQGTALDRECKGIKARLQLAAQGTPRLGLSHGIKARLQLAAQGAL
jgi:hypothetical protein